MASSSHANAPDAAATDDFAMSMFDMHEAHHTMRKQQAIEEAEHWWIVLQPKVAVRPTATTEGKPLCVLPQGSVVRAAGLERVDGVRWLTLHADDLPMLVKNKKQPNTAAEPPPP